MFPAAVLFSVATIVYGVFLASMLHFRRGTPLAGSGRAANFMGHTSEFWFFLAGSFSLLAVGVTAVNQAIIA